MYQDILENPGEAKHYKAFHVGADGSIGEPVEHCIWADDTMGSYCVYVVDDKGNFVTEFIEGEYDKSLKTEIRKGRIKLRRVK